MPLTLPAFVSALSAVLALAAAASLVGLLPLPRWPQHRWLLLTPVCGAVYAACDVALTSGWSAPTLLLVNRVQMTMAALWGLVWLRYTDEDLGRLPPRVFRLLAIPIALSPIVFWIPGLAYTGALRIDPSPWPGVRYRIAAFTVAGSLAGGAFLLALAITAIRYARAVLRGVQRAVLHFAATTLLLVAATNDILLATRFEVAFPFSLDVAYVLAVVCMGLVLMSRWKDDMVALASLPAQLEARVEQRSRELEQAMRALSRTEKLAAIGRLAAGIAHEINNPAAVVAGNVDYLLESRSRAGELPADAPEALAESREAIDRISSITRRLLAGSNAARQEDGKGFDVAVAAAAGAERVRTALRPGVELSLDVARGLLARGSAALVEQVLVDLAQNAAESVPEVRAGSVRIFAEREGDRVLVRVRDDGSGMDEQTLARVFEPFFSTKPVGKATGLSLAVSLALLRTIGGDLRVESEVGRGTTVTVVLEAMPAGARAAA